MQATDSHANGSNAHGLTTGAEPQSDELRRRLLDLADELGAAELARVVALVDEPERSREALRDAVSTRLMEAFRVATANGIAGPRGAGMNLASFGLLYELNARHLLVQVAARLRRYQSTAEAHDVLHEVFLNVYRYPHRFDCGREDAFRVWSAMIVRNTVLKHIRAQKVGGMKSEVVLEDLAEQPERRPTNPLGGVIEQESQVRCTRAYLIYLQLYLRFYEMLSEREQRALHLVEIDELGYRDAARELGIKLENLKMVVFRARKKIHRSMRRVFEGLDPDIKPSRGRGERDGDLLPTRRGAATPDIRERAGNDSTDSEPERDLGGRSGVGTPGRRPPGEPGRPARGRSSQEGRRKDESR